VTTTPVHLPVDDQIADAISAFARGDDDIAVSTVDQLSADDRRRTLFGMMRAAGELDAEIAALEAYRRIVDAEIAATVSGKTNRKAWLEEQIKRTAEPLLTGKSKNVDMPGAGRVQYRDYGETLSIADPEAYIAALDADERERLVELRPHLKTNDAKQYAATVLAEHGEVMPGVERIPARRTATVSYVREVLS